MHRAFLQAYVVVSSLRQTFVLNLGPVVQVSNEKICAVRAGHSGRCCICCELQLGSFDGWLTTRTMLKCCIDLHKVVWAAFERHNQDIVLIKQQKTVVFVCGPAGRTLPH